MKKLHQLLQIISISTLLLAPTFLRAQAPAAPAQAPAAPVRIACVGDSITFGKGTSRGPDEKFNSYPALLQRMLGREAEVGNFGKNGSTLLNAGGRPYQKLPMLKAALAFNPGVVVIQLGTNDTLPVNWAHKDQFVADYLELVRQFQALTPATRIFLCLPPWIGIAKSVNFSESALQEQLPLIKKVAEEKGATVIDVHGAFLDKKNLLADGLHPNDEGAAVLAKTVYAAIKGKPFTGEIPGPLPASEGAATKGQ